MLEYLQLWLITRAGAAPVWVSVKGDTKMREYVMRGVDQVGVVLAPPSSPDDGIAFPWPSIMTITPNRVKS